MSIKSEKHTTLSESLLRVISLSERLPYASKAANDFLWARNRAQALDAQYGDTDPEYIKRVQDNYRLLNGMAMTNYKEDAYRESMIDAMSLKSEGIDAPDLKVEHIDVVSPFIDGLWGDQKRANFKFAVTDSSVFTKNYIKDFKDTNLKMHFEEKMLGPAKQLALLQWQEQNGVTDLFTLSPEDRQKLQAEVNASAETLIPKDIMSFMKNGAMGNLEKQGQALAEALSASLELKYRLDDAYLHSFASDGIVFYSGIRRGKVFTEWVDLQQFNTGGTPDIFIDKNEWFKRVKYKHPATIWTEYGDQFTKKDIERFDNLVTAGGGQAVQDLKDEKFVMRIDYAGQEMLSKTNLLTTEGQDLYSHIMQKYVGSGDVSTDAIRTVHLVWKSLDKFKEITRGYGNGDIVVDYFTEDYEFNPQHGDLEEKIIWVPRYWQVLKIGEGPDPIMLNIGPVPFQNRDITDPYDVKSSYTGGYLHDMSGLGYRRSPLDKVKPLIHMVNTQFKTIKDREATDIGKVVLMTVAAKPKGWSWGKLVEVIRATKMLPINTQQSGLTAADVQFFREIDLSNLYDMLPRINYLQFMIQKIGEGLSSNSARQGTPAASTSVSNNMQNLSRSFSQTHARKSWIDKIAEHLIENLIYLGKSAIKNGNIFYRYSLDDLSTASIDIDIAELEDAYFGVRVNTDEVDLEKLEIPRNLLLPYIQSRDLSFKLAMETVFASSRGEFMSIATEAEMESQMKQAQAMDFQRMSQEEMAKKQTETEVALMELKTNLKMMEDAQNNEAKKEMAAIQSMTIAHGNDINNNQENDYLESAALDRDQKREEVLIKDALERDKLALEDQWTKEELLILKDKVEKMAVKKPPTTRKKSK